MTTYRCSTQNRHNWVRLHLASAVMVFVQIVIYCLLNANVACAAFYDFESEQLSENFTVSGDSLDVRPTTIRSYEGQKSLGIGINSYSGGLASVSIDLPSEPIDKVSWWMYDQYGGQSPFYMHYVLYDSQDNNIFNINWNDGGWGGTTSNNINVNGQTIVGPERLVGHWSKYEVTFENRTVALSVNDVLVGSADLGANPAARMSFLMYYYPGNAGYYGPQQFQIDSLNIKSKDAQQSLALSLNGTGNGYVLISPLNSVINTSSSTELPFGSKITLHANSAQFSEFSGWNGECSGSSDCTLTMDSNKTVYATFNKGTRSLQINLPDLQQFSNFNDAYLASVSGALIKAWGTSFNESVRFNQEKNVIINGGCNTGYTACQDFTAINGSMVVQRGSVKVRNLIIRGATPNRKPIANAGTDQSVLLGAKVYLNGYMSGDADGDMITYRWVLASKPAGSDATLSSTIIANPTFTSDVAGTFVFNLTVNDGKSDSATSTVKIISTKHNSAPVASAGLMQNVFTGTTVTLDGSQSSDNDGDLLTCSWSFTSKPEGSNATLSDSTVVNPAFNADLSGVYVLNLVVNDGQVTSEPSTVTINAIKKNSAPVANAGLPQSLITGSIVTLDGSESTDADGDSITFSWSFSSKPVGSNATLSNQSVSNPTFKADLAGVYVLILIVSDGTASGNASTVTIHVTDPNIAPVADAGDDQFVSIGAIIALDGTGSFDANGEEVTYNWAFSSVPSGSSAQIINPASPRPTFVADAAGAYVVNLIVNDGELDSTISTVTINASVPNAAPVANAGESLTVRTGKILRLNGSGSSDADNDSLTYSWSFVSKPTGSVANLSQETLIDPTFTPDVDGTYVISLKVNDGRIDSSTAIVNITAFSDQSKFFTTNQVYIGGSTNGYINAGSKFSMTIVNISNETFVLNKAELSNGGVGILVTTDPSLLNNNLLAPGQSAGVQFSLPSMQHDNGFRFTYYLTDTVTNQDFTVYHDYVTNVTIPFPIPFPLPF